MKEQIIKNLVKANEDYIKYITKVHISIQKRFSDALLENNDLPPTIDSLGRFHAPCDGYMDYDSGFEYLKGQFIPMPEVFFNGDETIYHEYRGYKDGRQQHYSESLKCSGDMLDFINSDEFKELQLCDVRKSRTWIYNGVENCYVEFGTFSKKLSNDIRRVMLEWSNHNTRIEDENKQKVLEERAKLKGIAPESKQTIRGVVLSSKITEGYYGFEHKMMVELENKSTVYGSVPKAICDVEAGDEIEFSANFEHSKSDKTHSFYKRPTKAKIINPKSL